jgi:hypothetical protein
MNPNLVLWENGGFTRITASMRDRGEVLINVLEIKTVPDPTQGAKWNATMGYHE